jgi:hypothetical protein
MLKKQVHDFEGLFLGISASGKAIKVELSSGPKDGEEIWFPLSLIEYTPMTADVGDKVEVTVPEWWAKQEEIL